MKRKKCKKVLIIDATDYPLIRVIKPLTPEGLSGSSNVAELLEGFSMKLWAFYDYSYE